MKWLLLVTLVTFAAMAQDRSRQGTIYIDEALYGAGAAQCDARPALERNCNGRSVCGVDVRTPVLCTSDPARGQRKALYVLYSCGRGSQIALGAEGSRIEFDCGRYGGGSSARYGISIDDVRYGRGRRTCDATRAFVERCDGQPYCSVTVNNGLCGDPARNERKYADILYRCERRQQRLRVSEGDRAQLRCD